MSPIVNTFIVGMPKAGTTSLHRYLSEHPNTCMAEDKEPHYFSTDLLQEGAEFHGHPKYTRYPTIEKYHSLFGERGEAMVVGESSVFYLFSKQAAQEIYQYNPDSKIIIMLREPVAFLYSLHSQGLYSGNEVESDFSVALDLESNRRNGQEIPNTVHFPSRLFYRDHVQIAEQIQRYIDVFPLSQIKVILFDDFKSQTEEVVRETLEFLELDSSIMPNLVNHNQNTKMKSQRLARIIQDPSHPITSTAKKLLPRKFWKQGKVWLKRINTDHSPRSVIDPELKIQLRAEVTPQVEALNTLLHQYNFVSSEINLLDVWQYDSTGQ